MNAWKSYQLFSAKWFHTNSVIKAFIANAFVTAVIAIATVEIHRELHKESNEENNEIRKGFLSFLSAFVAGMITYVFMWLVFNFGGGMVTINRKLERVTPLFKIAQ